MSDSVVYKTPVSDKRAAILETTLDLISERGFHNTPMSLVAKESSVSTGSIYHYFASKDELIFELYKEIKLEMLRSTMKGFSEQLSIREGFLRLWFNFIEYHMYHPRRTAFLEQFENSPYSEPSIQEAFTDEIAPFIKFVNQGIEEGVLKDLPLQVEAALTFGVAVSLAQQHIAGTLVLDNELIEATAEACWDAIAR
ncbi:MAG: TetR/AcrR family transcriptional regulator [Anaerolineae bacterium]|nr:MAG: TetR/AcrR family transcriptional regulator [Anaerolineae bacterium]